MSENGRKAARPARDRRLLVMACSMTKRRDPGDMPGIERYDGPLWRTLRSVDPSRAACKVAHVSAHGGFRDSTFWHVPDYDVRMTDDIAEAMIAGGVVTRWPRPRTKTGPDTGVHAGGEIASMSRYGRSPFEEVALVGGGTYLGVMRALMRGFVEMGCVVPEAGVTEINGAIGFMRRDLGAWLRAGL